MKTIHQLLKQKNYTAITFKPIPTYHLEIMAKINGIEGRFILDTGASNTCLGLNCIDTFGLKTEESEIKASGAGATEIDTHISQDNILEIGSWKKSRITLVLFDLSHVNTALEAHNCGRVHGIIGADILKKGKAIIDYPKKRLYLKN